MSDQPEPFSRFQPKHPFLVGIDSDGCAFDTMEVKHKECFIPNTINEWELQAVSKYAREAAEFVNLYSKWRGINRFPALLMTFDLLAPASYKLGNGQVAYQFGYGSHVVTLRDESGQVIAQPGWGDYVLGEDDPFYYISVASGVLVPGRYRLTAEWNRGFPGDPGQWDAAAVLQLTAIPEPATALLLASGLGWLAARRRRSES